MQPETRQALADARLAATRIQQVSDPLDEQRFRDDWLAQSAVERQFMVLGEALIRVKRLEPSVLDSVTDHHKIIGLRHLLAHGYDAVDAKQLFRATTIERADPPHLPGQIPHLHNKDGGASNWDGTRSHGGWKRPWTRAELKFLDMIGWKPGPE